MSKKDQSRGQWHVVWKTEKYKTKKFSIEQITLNWLGDRWEGMRWFLGLLEVAIALSQTLWMFLVHITTSNEIQIFHMHTTNSRWYPTLNQKLEINTFTLFWSLGQYFGFIFLFVCFYQYCFHFWDFNARLGESRRDSSSVVYFNCITNVKCFFCTALLTGLIVNCKVLPRVLVLSHIAFCRNELRE